jgi:hypothetical protein
MVCSSHTKKRHGSFKLGLEWTHKQEFKVKSICTNQEKRLLMQIATKLMHVSKLWTQFKILTMAQTCKEFITLPIIYSMISGKGCTKVTINLGTPQESWKFMILPNKESCNFVGSWFLYTSSNWKALKRTIVTLEDTYLILYHVSIQKVI